LAAEAIASYVDSMTRVRSSAAAAATPTSSKQTWDDLDQQFNSLSDAGKVDQAVALGKKWLAAAKTPDQKRITTDMVAQLKLRTAALAAEAKRDIPTALKLWNTFAKKWPPQASEATDHAFTLSQFQKKLPPSATPLSSGADIARRVLQRLDEATRAPLHFSRAGDAVMLEFRQMMRPLVGLDLNWRKDIAPADAKRFKDFVAAIAAAGKAVPFDNLAVQYSGEDPVMGDGTPNGLLAWGLVKFTPRSLQDAYGIHSLHE
jgi:hypothetical protein